MFAHPDSLVGTVVQDRYRILEFLAEGAMGAVYRAERVGLERQVAIKFLNPAFAANPQAAQRFEREAKAMSRLDHPNCVSVMDFGVLPAPFIVMEYVTGETLRDLVDRGPMQIERALYICRGILAGLAHAHEQKIVHRDIKPANVMITEAAGTDGLVRILDFGLAKLRDKASSDLSTSWMVVGTPSYMSPEQGQGGDVDARSDLYSTGVLLFELVTGEKPFQGGEAFETLQKHREDPIPLLEEVAPAVNAPGALQDIIDRALAKKVEDRYASAIEFATDLKELAGSMAGGLGAVGKRRSVVRPYAATEQFQAVEQPEPSVLDPLALAGTHAMQVVDEPVVAVRSSTSSGRSRFWRVAIVAAVLGGAAATAFAYGHFTERFSEPPEVVAKTSALAEPGASAPSEKPEAIVAAHEPIIDTDAAAAGLDPVRALDAGMAPPALLVGDAALAVFDASVAGLAAEELDEDGEPETPEELAAEETSVDPPEAEHEPAVEAVVEARPVRTVADVERLLAEGKREQALTGLRLLKSRQPRSSYFPLLLGNLYFENKWWTKALGEYEQAIHIKRTLRSRPVLIQNTIRALGSTKTRWKAQSLILNRIGRSAVPHLRQASRHDKNILVRKRAAALLRRITSPPRKKTSRAQRTRRRR